MEICEACGYAPTFIEAAMNIVHKEIERLEREISARKAEALAITNDSGTRIAVINKDVDAKTLELAELKALLTGDTQGGLQGQIDQLNADIAAANEIINSKNTTIAEKDAALVNRDAAIASLNQLVAQRDATIAQKDATIATKDATIATKDGVIATRTTERDAALASVAPLQSQITSLKTQNRQARFGVFNEIKSAGSLVAHGLRDIRVYYEAQIVAPGDAPADPPNVAHLDQFFGEQFSQFGNVRIVIDYEAWWSGAGSAAVDEIRTQYYVTAINRAKAAGFTNVGVYSSWPERYYGAAAATGQTRIDRLASWKARCQISLPIAQAATVIYPSYYLLNPVHDNATNLNRWIDDNYDLCAELAPGKPVIPFCWYLYHPSLGNVQGYQSWALTHINGAYWRGMLNKIFERHDGVVIWGGQADPDPTELDPLPGWWTETAVGPTCFIQAPMLSAVDA